MTTCQLCGQTTVESNTALSIIDYSVTGETFTLTKCNNCEAWRTNIQQLKNLDKYYESTDYASHHLNPYNPIHLIYKFARYFTTRSKIGLIKQFSKANTVLDYGCGTGNFLATLERAGFKVKGLEPNAKARDYANWLTKGKVITSLTELTETYDVITLWHVLEHTYNPLETLKLLKNQLNKEGKIIIAVPNYKSKDAAIYQQHWAGYDVPRHLWHFTQKTIDTLAVANELKVTRVIPMKLDSFYVSLLSEKYKASNKQGLSQLIRAIKSGWQSNQSARNTGEYSSLIYVLAK